MRLVKCPKCGRETVYAPANKYRPFCSERCAILDLGAWADEKYKVPTNETESESVNEKSDDESDARVEIPPKDHQN
jgi:endogenous inhibitor of DNA gyrase (YacG/DUF329 family)